MRFVEEGAGRSPRGGGGGGGGGRKDIRRKDTAEADAKILLSGRVRFVVVVVAPGPCVECELLRRFDTT